MVEECIILLLPQSIVNTVFSENLTTNEGGGMYNELLPQVLSIRCLAEIKLLMVAECIMNLLPLALSIVPLAEIQLL